MKNLCPHDIFWSIPGEELRVPPSTIKLPDPLTGFDQFANRIGCKLGESVAVPEDNPELVDRCKKGGLRVEVYNSSGIAVRQEPLGIFHLVDTDNFSGDYPDEKFVAKEIHGLERAKVLADAMNAKYCNHDSAPRFYKVVPDGYKLRPGFEP